MNKYSHIYQKPNLGRLLAISMLDLESHTCNLCMDDACFCIFRRKDRWRYRIGLAPCCHGLITWPVYRGCLVPWRMPSLLKWLKNSEVGRWRLGFSAGVVLRTLPHGSFRPRKYQVRYKPWRNASSERRFRDGISGLENADYSNGPSGKIGGAHLRRPTSESVKKTSERTRMTALAGRPGQGFR
jgi:hypothetical protein